MSGILNEHIVGRVVQPNVYAQTDNQSQDEIQDRSVSPKITIQADAQEGSVSPDSSFTVSLGCGTSDKPAAVLIHDVGTGALKMKIEDPLSSGLLG